MSKQNIFEILGPGKSFAIGIVTTLLVIFSVGFFVLLFSGDNSFSFDSGSEDKYAGFNQPAADSDGQAPSAQPNNQAAGEIKIAPLSDADHVRGDLNKADIVVVEFSDYECPFCQRFDPTMKQIVADYGGKVAWVYRHFPLDSLHPEARGKAEASECVTEQGGNEAFWKFNDRMYDASQAKITISQLPDFVESIGLDVDVFNDCVKNRKYKDKVNGNYQDAVSSGGRGTPYSVVITKDGKKKPISGALPLAQIKSVIDPLLSK
jgi:protein-disulfide isomerase